MAVRYAALCACRKVNTLCVTLAHKRKQKFFYFGCSLVRQSKKVNKNKTTSANGTDGQTDRQTECDAICDPLLGRRAA